MALRCNVQDTRFMGSTSRPLSQVLPAMTFESRLKKCLPVGLSVVCLTHLGISKKALVDISPRGKVQVLMEPDPTAMYSSWTPIKKDQMTGTAGRVIVWAARCPEMREAFTPPAVATIPLVEAN